METELVVVRLLHIVFGVFWAGSSVFLALILEPRLRALGPAIQRPVTEALMPVLGPALAISSTITIVAGVYLALRLRWGHLDRFLDTGWGWAILIGFVVSIPAFAAGVATGVQAKRMQHLGGVIEGRSPTGEEVGELQRLDARITFLGRATAGLVLVAVGSMASARFV